MHLFLEPSYLNQPRLESVVNDDVVSITLETVSVIRHDVTDSFERVNDQPRNVVKQSLRDLSRKAFFKYVFIYFHL